MSSIYVFQIVGLLEHPETKKIGGIRVMICSANVFEQVDTPAECLSTELRAFLRFRSAVCDHFDVRRLPYGVQNELRESLGKWLDRYVLDKAA